METSSYPVFKTGRRIAGTAAAVLLAAGIFVVPLFVTNQFWLNALIMAHLTAAFVATWDFLAGPVGQLSGGQALFLGGAGYVAALVGLAGANPWLGMLLGLVFAVIAGAVAGLLSLRVTGPFLILATLALAEIAHESALAVGFISEQGYAIGGEGGIPLLQILPRNSEGFFIKAYFLSALLLVGLVVGFYMLARSPLGLQLKAAGRDILSAEAAGINTTFYRLLGFAVAAGAAGLVGVFWGQYVGRVTPSLLTLQSSFGAMVLAVIGGRGTIIGPAMVAYLSTAIFSWLWVDPHYQQLVYALALLVLIRLRSAI